MRGSRITFSENKKNRKDPSILPAAPASAILALWRCSGRCRRSVMSLWRNCETPRRSRRCRWFYWSRSRRRSSNRRKPSTEARMMTSIRTKKSRRNLCCKMTRGSIRSPSSLYCPSTSCYPFAYPWRSSASFLRPFERFIILTLDLEEYQKRYFEKKGLQFLFPYY